MNFQNLNFDHVEQPRMSSTFPCWRIELLTESLTGQHPPQTPDSFDTIRPPPDHRFEDYASSRPATSNSPQPAGTLQFAPSPPSPSGSGTEIYGPERLFGPSNVQPLIQQPRVLSSHAFERLRTVPQLTVDEIQDIALHRAVLAQMSFGQGYKDQLAFEAGKVTPGVDDTPYIQYALQALTRDRNPEDGLPRSNSVASYETNPFHRTPVLPDAVFYPPLPGMPPPVEPQHAQLRGPMRYIEEERKRRPLAAFDPNPSPNSSLSTLVVQPKTMPKPFYAKDAWVRTAHNYLPRNVRAHSRRPDFQPKILRPASLFTLMTLCMLMIIALIFCAVYSQLRGGLVGYSGSIYGGQYFLFRILPPLLAVLIQMHTHAVILAIFRILPFRKMVGYTPDERYGALFQDLYPRSFLWPHLKGNWHTWVPCLIAWVGNFAVPLQSTLFTPNRVNGGWRWATVQGVAWTLVVLYLALLASVVILYLYWRRRDTGLIWDARSIADIAALATNSNTLADYRGAELLGSKAELRWALRRREVDQIGYWRWRDQRNADVWHGIATEHVDEAWLDREVQALEEQRMSRGKEKMADEIEVEPSPRQKEEARLRYLPWCLRNNQMLYFVVTAVVLFTALLVVSFLPSTNVRSGFRPRVSSAPQRGAFSPANFLYAFIPALLGQIMVLLFQSLELSVRILQPWAEMQSMARTPRGGALPERSILADYAACLPLQTTWRAARNGHLRLAVLSLLAVLFTLIPVLAGGTFTALTTRSGEVRMLPNIPAFAIALTLLALYLLALVAMLPGRADFRLPHAVNCIAEIISFVANGDAMGDDAFKRVLHRNTMRGKIGVDRAPAHQPRWVFGFGGPGSGDARLGVRRVRRFTELEKSRSMRRRRELEAGWIV
jgi:hypothetical protein